MRYRVQLLGNGSVVPYNRQRVNKSEIPENNETYRYGPGNRLNQSPKGFQRN